MRARHVAYGLDLRCSFELVGMPARAGEGLPTVALELVSATQLESCWSGASGRYSWTGGLGDGCTLSIEAGAAGELRFAYGERAHFLLSADGELLRCAPLQPGLHWQQVLLARILPDVALARGYEALHASALESPAGVVAIAAPSGTGKTTLALALQRRGWRLFADDVLVLGTASTADTAGWHPPSESYGAPPRPHGAAPGPHRTRPQSHHTASEPHRAAAGPHRAAPERTGVMAHPGTPHMNVATSVAKELAPPSLGETLGTLAGERWVALANNAQSTRPVRAVLLLERGPGLALQAQPLAASPLALAPYMLGLADEPDRERRRFALYCDLTSTASLLRLSGGPHDTPAQLAELVEQTLPERPLLTIEGSA